MEIKLKVKPLPWRNDGDSMKANVFSGFNDDDVSSDPRYPYYFLKAKHPTANRERVLYIPWLVTGDNGVSTTGINLLEYFKGDGQVPVVYDVAKNACEEHFKRWLELQVEGLL